MRLLFIADGRSPIALNWLSFFIARGDEVHLASTFPCNPPPELASLTITPVAFSEVKRGHNHTGREQIQSRWGSTTVGLRTALRRWVGPLTVDRAASRLRVLIQKVQPDLVHAMRIPYEGMLAATALRGRDSPPLLISIWGNDFTLHAPATPFMARYTRRVLQRADALHADCRRDLRLSHQWGFNESRPSIVLPGAGGVQREWFYPPAQENRISEPPIVINPRGIRVYVRNDTFFRAIPMILERRPTARFICPAMAGQTLALRWVERLNITSQVDLLPQQSRLQMADLFRCSHVAVSPSTHDGTPNTLLEAMACGCFPVAGDIESLREWIEPGVNGLLVDPADSRALATAILQALSDDDLVQCAHAYNLRLVQERAEYSRVMADAVKFYQKIISISF